MRFDIVRAWKDESYRQGLDIEQRECLPASPVGELSDAELAAACGTWGFGPGVGFDGYGFLNDCATFGPGCADIHFTSRALVCEVNVFTINADALLGIPAGLFTGPNGNCTGIR
jgi:mersacidin/lichenicidin family type 2 lantibiotic